MIDNYTGGIIMTDLTKDNYYQPMTIKKLLTHWIEKHESNFGMVRNMRGDELLELLKKSKTA
ncbi:hypothetical protein LCGC14_0854880 [marine sediment metagenome]|uniref:Uncharacterized protein n=1 Tax=marine sediment metagenome TaxID=412755 RepID=A0A0F9PUE3_9ZZZZ